MSTKLITDSMLIPATESPQPTSKTPTDTTEVESAKCDCCGLTEECTPEYINRIRERYKGNWICGLCGEAVKDEIVRSKRLITTEEAMARHVSFCRTQSDPTARLIAAVRQILRRSFDSPASVKSMPCSPTTKVEERVMITRSESCIPKIRLVVDSDEDGEGAVSE